MILRIEDDLVHRHLRLVNHSARIKQDKRGYQTQNQMPIRGVFTVHVTGSRGQQVFEGTERLINLVTLAPPKQPRRWNGDRKTQKLKPSLTGFVDENERHLPIGQDRGPQPRIAAAWRIGTLTPRRRRYGKKRNRGPNSHRRVKRYKWLCHRRVAAGEKV